jgi:hypothetical protein
MAWKNYLKLANILHKGSRLPEPGQALPPLDAHLEAPRPAIRRKNDGDTSSAPLFVAYNRFLIEDALVLFACYPKKIAAKGRSRTRGTNDFSSVPEVGRVGCFRVVIIGSLERMKVPKV